MITFFKKLEEGLLSLFLVAMTVLVLAEVIARFVFNHGIMWAQEVTLILNSWMVLLAASYCIREKAHIGVDFLVNKLQPKSAKIALLFALVCCVLYSLIYLYGAAVFVWEDYKIGIELEDLPIPTWMPASALVIGFALVLVQFIVAFYRVIVKNDLHVLSHEGEVKESMELAESLQEMQQTKGENK